MTATRASDYIITPEAVQTAGLVSYWRLSGPVTLSQLKEEWTKAGLDPAVLPNPPGEDVALGRAVHDETGIVRSRVSRGKEDAQREERQVRWLVRSLTRRGSWALVEETVTQETVDFETLLTVKSGPTFECSAQYHEVVARIRASYTRRLGEIEPEDISSWLVKIARKLNSVPLRDTGGIYFIPGGTNGADLWQRIVDVITRVSAHRVFSIPALKNSDAIAAITDAITQEAEAAAAALDRELGLTGEEQLGARAIKSRQEQVDVLLAKIGAYDELLGVQLQVRERIERLSASLVQAVLLSTE